MKWIKSFFQLSGSEKILLFEAVYYLYLAKISIQIFSFKKIVKYLSKETKDNISPEPELLRNIKFAVSRANKLAFWNNVCLVKSLAARKLLHKRRISSRIYLGLRFENDKKLSAHAWLVCDGFFITPRGDIQFKEIMSF